jgi:hypothetical protein
MVVIHAHIVLCVPELKIVETDRREIFFSDDECFPEKF